MIPFEYELWTPEQCGAYFGISGEHFLKKKRYAPGFPKPVTDENEKPRWRAKSVAEWAVKETAAA